MVREMDFVDEYYADKDLSLLKKLTLVIPTYNRNYYLSRCLWYHAHFPFGQIIVADSSPEEKKVVNRETVSKVREIFGADILYLEYEPETEKYGGDIYRKWGDAVMHVETEYSQICTDKEFYVPNTQISCIKFLEEHSEYASADGEYYNIEGFNLRKYYFKKVATTKCSLTYKNPLVRYLISISRANGSTNLMAIRRTSMHKYIYNQLLEYNINDIRFGEIIQELLTILLSKSKYFEGEIYCCKDFSRVHRLGHLNLSESSDMRYPRLNQYVLDGVYNRYFQQSVMCLSNILNDNISIVESREELANVINITLKQALGQRGYFGYVGEIGMILSSVPKVIKRLLEISMGFIYTIIIIKGSKNKIFETKIIERVIQDSKHFHKHDKPML